MNVNDFTTPRVATDPVPRIADEEASTIRWDPVTQRYEMGRPHLTIVPPLDDDEDDEVAEEDAAQEDAAEEIPPVDDDQVVDPPPPPVVAVPAVVDNRKRTAPAEHGLEESGFGRNAARHRAAGEQAREKRMKMLERIEARKTSLDATVDAFTLRQALARVKPAVSSRGGSLPVLSGVRVDVAGERVRLTATDLDLTLITDIGADINGPGLSPVVPAFGDIDRLVKKASAKTTGPVTIVGAGDEARLTYGRARMDLRTLPADEWPRDGGLDGAVSEAAIDSALLAELVPACSKDDARPILTAVCFDGGSLAATDSYRLYVIDGLPDLGVRFLLPSRAASVAAKHGGVATLRYVPGEERGGVRDAGRDAEFVFDDLLVRSRLVDGEYPNYRGLIPTDLPGRLEVDTADLSSAVGEVQRLMPNTVSPIRITGDGDKVLLQIVEQDKGTVTVDIDGRMTGTWHGATVAFNPGYLVAALDGMGDAVVGGIDALKPAVIRRVDDQGLTHMRLVMPVRIA